MFQLIRLNINKARSSLKAKENKRAKLRVSLTLILCFFLSLSFTALSLAADTWQDIRYAYLRVYNSNSGQTYFSGYYDQQANKFYLRSDDNTSWLGGYAPGSAVPLENSSARLNCSSTTISGAGTLLDIDWSGAFKLPLTARENIYFSLYLQDYAGNSLSWTDKGAWTISADTIPSTGSITINNDAPYTNSTAVTLSLLAQDEPSGSGLSQMQFSNDNLTWSTPQDYAATKAWTLTSGEGTKRVYVKFKDGAGNWSQAFQDSIIFDSTPPGILINSVTSPRNQNVSLSYTVTDNFTLTNEIRLSGDNSPYTNEGTYNITLNAQDLAGNVSSASVSFAIDKNSPVINIASPQDGVVVEDAAITLQGTIDGVAFSESRTLVEGENVLTKTATDAAGNISSASVRVYLYSGKTIGPAGGEVYSQDGKVKLIIPAGALNAPERIRVLTVNKETLLRVAPTGTSLLSAVECKPTGLVFNKPVLIIYTLNQAEIPGTPLELGLYNSLQDKVILTDQASPVQSDGYTLSFNLTAF